MLNFNQSMTELIEEIVEWVPEFSPINPKHLRVSVTKNRRRGQGGLIAYVLPLKFKDGNPVEVRQKGKKEYHYGMLPLSMDGVEVLYIINFMLPRFYNLSFRHKIETIIHELYHIGPQCNGDVRRLKGRSHLHGDSLEDYDRKVQKLTDQFLLAPHRTTKYGFLKRNMRQARRHYGTIQTFHIKEPKPKLLKVY